MDGGDMAGVIFFASLPLVALIAGIVYLSVKEREEPIIYLALVAIMYSGGLWPFVSNLLD